MEIVVALAATNNVLTRYPRDVGSFVGARPYSLVHLTIKTYVSTGEKLGARRATAPITGIHAYCDWVAARIRQLTAMAHTHGIGLDLDNEVSINLMV